MSDLHVVIGASGGAGGAVVRALSGRDDRVRAVSRSGRGPHPAGVEVLRADARDAGEVRDACRGAAVVYHCVNVPYADWGATLPAVMDAVVAGAAAADATLVYCDNLYMYGPADGPLTEDSPRSATGAKGRLRLRLADGLMEAHEAGRVRAVIGRGSDFYGPGAVNTLAGQLVFPAVAAGRRAHWIGALDRPHSLHYIDDFARCLITLGTDPRAPGRVWHVPAGPAPTGREFIQMAFAAATLPPKVGVYRRWQVRLAALFDRQMRESLEVLPQFERPFVIDGSRFVDTLGDPGLTPMPDGVERTLAWQKEAGAPPG